MDELKQYVDQLFFKYRNNKQVKDLKEEILSNLQAKVADLIADGWEQEAAIKKAKESIRSVDHLIDSNKKIYINQLKLEFVQIALMYSLVAWILTLPLQIFGMRVIINYILMFVCVGIGIVYLLLWFGRHNKFMQVQVYKNVNTAIKLNRTTWLLWGLFIVVSILGTTAIMFGSNIWFGRPVQLSGPYQFAVVGIQYLLPFITVIVPLLCNVIPKLMSKYEAGEVGEE